PEIQFAEPVIDNGSFGTRTVSFETGRLAKQAGGAVAVYLDEETMVLSTTTAGKHPREGFDFFPLTVDVEERQYAAGKIPGSFFRREGRPSTEAILACRLIDRPLRPLFVNGLRNEVQVVETVLSVHPDDAYDVVAINGASISTQISGLPPVRPPAAPAPRQGPAKRGAGRRGRALGPPRRRIRRRRDQRRLDLHPDLRPAVLRPGRRRPHRADRRRVGRVPALLRAGAR